MVMINDVAKHRGVKEFVVFFFTYGLWGNAGANAVSSGINAGYRLIDTAYNYENEGAVGEGIRRSGIPRDELWVTSKLPGRYHTYEKALVAIQESLFRAQLDYFDLYLI
ncbi:aldo/keto reductase, partial [Rossellomorea aquimaris]|uniref:aldo/keto reductase n=1 Tax=Rossellomorea aquimaris TaxID=189382 RepID=UPI003F8026B9